MQKEEIETMINKELYSTSSERLQRISRKKKKRFGKISFAHKFKEYEKYVSSAISYIKTGNYKFLIKSMLINKKLNHLKSYLIKNTIIII